MELASMVDFVRYAHARKLDNYTGSNIVYMLRLLYADEDAEDVRSFYTDNNSSVRGSRADQPTTHLEPVDEQESTHNLAHGLHFASIAMLGVLVLEVSRNNYSSFNVT